MKFSNVIRALLLMTFGLLAGGRVEGQTVWSMSVSNSPASVTLGNNITYVINITNLTGGTLNTTVTDSFPASAIFISATNNLFATTSNSPGQIVFFLPGFSTVPLQITVVLQPTNSGLFTNTVGIGSPIVTNTLTTNTVTPVNSLSTTLNVAVALPTNAVLVNDWITYDVTVTNPGANSATTVVLSNTLPTGATLISVSPTNSAYTLTNGAMVFNLGTLASKAGQTFAIKVQPTVAGTNVFLDSVTSSRSFPAMVTNNLVVAPFDTTQLLVTNISNTNYDPQVGLLEQSVTVTSISTNTISGLRVVIAGLPTNLPYNVAYNAVGTNNGNPFVEYAGTLAAAQSVALELEYARANINVPGLQFTAVPIVPPTNALASGTAFAITNIFKLPSGFIMIEFPATQGRTYAILYANNSGMSNAMQAQPSIVAPGNQVQWIDFGPPETISTPISTNSRFYQVIQTH